MAEQVEEIKKKLKDNITMFIKNGKITEAETILQQYQKIVNNDIETFSMKAILEVQKREWKQAHKILAEGLNIEPHDFDLLFNSGYLCELEKNYTDSLKYYTTAYQYASSDNLKKISREALQRIRKYQPNQKLVFICLKGLDSFIHDIESELSKEYDTKIVLPNDNEDIYKAIDWADIVWLEWGNESTIAATDYQGIANKKVIVRIHGYEVFSDMPTKINWNVVDNLVFVAEHKRNLFFQQFGSVIPQQQTCIIRNGIRGEKFNFNKEKKRNKNIAFVGNINYRKGLDLLLEFFYDLLQEDPEYELFIRGDHQDLRYKMAIETMIQELNLTTKVKFVERVADMNQWLQNMTYIVSSSLEESFHYSVGEGMLAGLKPVIHAWRESREIWPEEYIFRNSVEFRKIILDEAYEPKKYRDFVLNHYSLQQQIVKIKSLFSVVKTKKTNENTVKKSPQAVLETVVEKLKTPLNIKNMKDITLLMTTYNRSDLLLQDLERKYKFGSVPKLIVDDCSSSRHRKSLHQLKRKFNIVDIIHHKTNRGLAEAMKTGFHHIKTKYALSLDDDDILLCLDESDFLQDIQHFKENDNVIMIPRYIVNADEQNNLWLGYDRQPFHQIAAKDVLKQFFLTGEIAAFNAGAIYDAKLMEKYSAEAIFRIGEDLVRLSRLFGNDLEKKVVVSDNYIYIRRMAATTISSHPDPQKLVIHFLSLLVPGYYCLKHGLVSPNEAIHALKSRGAILQRDHQFGEEFALKLADYVAGEKSIDFAKEYVDEKLLESNHLPKEVVDISNFVTVDATEANEMQQNDLPKVSIVIPTYNRKRMLKDALESALAQDYPNLEVIVTDNASTDGTEEMVKGYLSDPRLQYVRHEQNIGAAANARNAFYNIATGKYALQLCDDDYLIDSNYISKTIGLFLKHKGLVLVHASCKSIDLITGEIQLVHYPSQILKGIDYFLHYEEENYPHVFGMMTAVFDRELSNSLAIEDKQAIGGDATLYLNLMLYGDVGVIGDYAGIYRHHQENMSHNLQEVLSNDQTMEAFERIKERALRKNISPVIIEKWLTFRLWKYVRWVVLSCINNEQRQIGMDFLKSIQKEYPIVYQEVKKSLSL